MTGTRTSVATALALAILGLSASDALACRCQGAAPPAVLYKRAHAVALAEVVSVSGTFGSPEGAVASMRLKQGWKRSVAKTFTVLERTTCAYDFKVGSTYLVFLQTTRDHADFSTSICSGTALESQAGARLSWVRAHGKAPQPGK